MSSFAWLDYSEAQKRQMLDVISLFREKTTRDELGIGTIRDAFADLFFPGTSTIQTRARYFLFIPWIYLELERRRTPSARVKQEAEWREYNLIEALQRSEATEGLIGARAGRQLRRLPSTIYWSGLQSWGIRPFPGNQWQYHRSLDSFYAGNRQLEIDNAANEFNEPLRRNWHSGLPEAPARFPEGVTFALTRDEARYLQEQILRHVPGTLLAFLADRGRPVDGIAFPWQHPQFSSFPELVKLQLLHARNFADVIHGAALLYNLMLAEKSVRELEKPWQDLVQRYEEELQEWAGRLAAREGELAAWPWLEPAARGSHTFWAVVRSAGNEIPNPTVQFVAEWLGLVLVSGSPETIHTNERARELISRREWRLKGKLARLHSSRALELWGGASGTGMLDYRWSNARILLNDILNAAYELEEAATHA